VKHVLDSRKSQKYMSVVSCLKFRLKMHSHSADTLFIVWIMDDDGWYRCWWLANWRGGM